MNVSSSVSPSSWKLIYTLSGIGFVCATLLFVIVQTTAETIAKNQAKYIAKAIADIFPEPDASVTSQQILMPDNSSERFYEVRNHQQHIIGYAIEAEGMGYQDAIRLLYGYSPYNKTIVGLKILSSKETPGLGDRITNDEKFLTSFKQLSVSLTTNNFQLQHKIEVAKRGRKKHLWQIDTISGATISSRAVISIVSKSSEIWIPLLERQLENNSIGN